MNFLALSWQAASLDERLDALRHAPDASHQFAASAPDDPLGPWVRAAAPGQPDALLRRLLWDGISDSLARAALTVVAPPPTYRSAAWVEAWSVIHQRAEHMAGAVGTASWDAQVAEAGATAPFADVWMPTLAAARQWLSERCADLDRVLGPEAQRALDRHLLHGLSRLGELALLDFFRTQGHSYHRVVRDLLGAGTGPLAETYPVLARQTTELAMRWVETTGELVARLETDRDLLTRTFGDATGPVAALAPGLSDRHAGGRQVARLTFASGLSLAYKPRGLALECGMAACCDWLRAHGLACAPRLPQTLDRGTYGWARWEPPADLRDAADARAYFRSAGALVCLSAVFGGADLHSENVVAGADGPVLIDAEMLLQPEGMAAPDATVHDPAVDAAEPGACLRSGLVSAVAVDRTGHAFDIGGLRPSPARTRVVPARRWHGLREDGIGFTEDTLVTPTLANLPRLGGQLLTPDQHADEVVDGFDAAYAALSRLRAALLAEDGPLAKLADAPVRVLFRPSDQYAALLHVLAAPAYQRRGIDRSLALETLCRVFAAETTRPRLWPLVREERAALEACDLPRLTLPGGATGLTTASGASLPPTYARSGLDAVRRRLAHLSADDCAMQIDALRDALTADAPDRGPAVEVTTPADNARSTARAWHASAPPDADLLAAAEAIGHLLLARAHPTPDGALAWRALGSRDDLYGGSAGVGLYLAALAHCTGARQWRDAAAAVFAGVEHSVSAGDDRAASAALRLGACTGAPSVAYALLVGSHLLERPALADRACARMGALPETALDSDTVLDVEGGAAGALLVALAVLAVRDEARVRAVAARCAARLLAAQETEGPGRGGWRAGDVPRIRPGFAHGASGIAAALGRWAARSGDAAAADAVARAWAYERRVAGAHGGAWPTERADGSRLVMAAWCHGAPGVALGRREAPPPLADAGWAADLAEAMRQTLAAPTPTLDHLCCGGLGRADIALTLGRAHADAAWVAAGVGAAEAVAARIVGQGRLGMRGRGFAHGSPTPALFQGLAGIGYQLLRTLAPDALPSLLAFDPPPVSAPAEDAA